MQPHYSIAIIAAVLAGVGMAACSMESPGSTAWHAMDTNGDGQISAAEFESHYSEVGIYNTWDADDDGWIDEDEFGDGLFDYYDDDDDGFISDAEWEDGIMVDDYGDKGLWDT